MKTKKLNGIEDRTAAMKTLNPNKVNIVSIIDKKDEIMSLALQQKDYFVAERKEENALLIIHNDVHDNHGLQVEFFTQDEFLNIK